MADINVLATWPHYVHHMQPIIDALRDHGVDVKVWSSRHNTDWGDYIHPTEIEGMGTRLWLVASSMDAEKCVGQRLIYLEHGSGQTYTADEHGQHANGYSSGRMDDAVMFLCPNLFVLNRREKNYPKVPSYLIGCPKMDEFYVGEGHGDVYEDTVALAFHWLCGVCDEARSAWEHYRPHLNKIVLGLRRHGVRVVGHSHPRIYKRVSYHYERHGIEWWDHDEVMWHAAVLAVDNSSLGYEFASLDRQTVWMNAPWYRRSCHHGLRFWDQIPGPQADNHEELIDKILTTFERDDWKEKRREVTDLVYPLRDGNSARRAAMAIQTLL